jgi:hypothetical protein
MAFSLNHGVLPLAELATITLAQRFQKGLEAAIRVLRTSLPRTLLEDVSRHVAFSPREKAHMHRRRRPQKSLFQLEWEYSNPSKPFPQWLLSPKERAVAALSIDDRQYLDELFGPGRNWASKDEEWLRRRLLR